MKQLAVVAIDRSEQAAAKACGTLHDRFEHRYDIGRRLRYDAENLDSRGLPLQRFRDLRIARLKLLEQPHVLDRDHRLIGEGPEQGDLLVRERTGCCAGYDDRP